eukprot:1160452-Pelagomonas_calceolata.AAC.8
MFGKAKPTQAVKALPTSRKRGHLGPRHHVFPPPRERKSQSIDQSINGDQEGYNVTSSSPCLISVMRVEISLLKNAPGANELISILDRMNTKLRSKLDDCMSIKTKIFKRLLSVRGVDAPAHT